MSIINDQIDLQLGSIPNINLSQWPKSLIVVKDLYNPPIEGQSAGFRTAFRQVLLTRLLLQPNVINGNANPDLFEQCHPCEGFPMFLSKMRHVFKAMTTNPKKPHIDKSLFANILVPYVLEFANPQQLVYYDEKLEQEINRVKHRKWPWGKPLNAAECKRYVKGREEALSGFEKRLVNSNSRYNQWYKWTPNKSTPKSIPIQHNQVQTSPQHNRIRKSKLLVDKSQEPSPKKSNPKKVHQQEGPSVTNPKVIQLTEENEATFRLLSVEQVLELFADTPNFNQALMEKLTEHQLTGEMILAIGNTKDLMDNLNLMFSEAYNLIKFINNLVFCPIPNDDAE